MENPHEGQTQSSVVLIGLIIVYPIKSAELEGNYHVAGAVNSFPIHVNVDAPGIC